MREFEFDDKDSGETVPGNLQEKEARKFQKEINKKLKKKKRGSLFEDGFSTHKRDPYKREKFNPRDFMGR